MMVEQGIRTHIELSRSWAFVPRRVGRGWLGGAGEGGEARVDMPHCWNRRDTFEPGAVYRQGFGGYRVGFEFAAGDDVERVWRLRAEGFYGLGEVWLNGRKLGRVDGQYLGFEMTLAGILRPGSNMLGIQIENRYHRHVLPGIRMPDFLLYGGLAGRVWLEGVARTHFVEAQTWVHCAAVSQAQAEMVIPFAVEGGELLPAGATVQWSVRDPEGREVARAAVRVGAGVARLVVESPRLWSVEAPSLYEAAGEIVDGARVVDRVRLRFGCRTAEFRPRAGFFLNGERVELHGCNRHESMPGFGNALPVALQRADARLLKEHGCNFVRLSHYPQSPVFLDACDEVGLLVYAELASWKSVRDGGWLRAAERQWRGMIARDRHHPSVILWGMGNEARSRRAYLRLREVATELDPTRVVTYAENHLYRARRKRTPGIPDVWGCNYELDELANGVEAARLENVVVSECSNYPPAVRGDLVEEAAQVALIAGDLARVRALNHPAVAGFALWCWADYATLRKQRFARHCGIVDAWRMPKMAALLMQAMFREDPVLHVHGDWAMEGAAQRTVHVFSNCARVELRAGGRVVRSLEGGPYWKVELPYEAEALTGEGTRGGGVATATLKPHGMARRLVLEEDGLFASGSAGRLALPVLDNNPRLLVLRVRAVDDDGVLAANWRGWVTVTVLGGGCVMAHTEEDRVTVAGGEGRIFVADVGADVAVRVDAERLEGGIWRNRRVEAGTDET